MNGTIVKVEELVKVESTIPNGIYMGTYGGYTVVITHDGRTFHLTTEEGVKGIGYKVMVKVFNGEINFLSINS